jgi:putative ABC transport system ATP-binding protein
VRRAGNLDKKTGESIIALFKRLAADEGLAILLTTHNTAFGSEADRVITLEDGRIVREENMREDRNLAAWGKQ